MAKLLHISASPRPKRSYSLRVAEAFVEAYKKAHPADTVAQVDVATAEIPAFGAMAVSAKYRILHGEDHTAEEAETWKAVEACIEQFKSADKYVLSSPMWNFGIPYRLKQYIDVLVQPGYTFSFSPEKGYQGLVTGKPALLILARGGAYAEGSDTAGYDMQMPYLKLILGFMGFTQIDTLVIEPTLQQGREAAQEKLSQAIAGAQERAITF